jgi:lipopolysaccharide/colanic/teichoic acid biosynthesis glycosyltransferase
MKRVFDLVLVTLGLLVIWPFLVLTALIVLISDGWPILFVQERVGKEGRPFRMLKFRTMKRVVGAALTIGADSRITSVGRVLRKLKLDEFPQLINVLKGEMSLVGPRPEIPRYVSLYSSEQRQVLELLPGITDPASLKYIDESTLLAEAKDPEKFYIETVMPDKIRLNLDYAKKATPLTDLHLIVKTVLGSFFSSV